MSADAPVAREMEEGEPQIPSTFEEPVDLKAFELLDDIYNMVNDYTAHGMDAFEESLAKNVRLDKLQLKFLLQGSAHLFSTLQADLTQHMQRFEQAALRDSLSVPPGLLHPSALPAALAAPCTPEDEQSADAQLAELRHNIKQVREERMNLDTQTLSMERELRVYGDLTELEAIAATVSGKENVAGDAAVIQSKARELEQLVPKLTARQATRSDTVIDPQKAALLVEREMQRAKAAMGGSDATGLLDKLQPHVQI